MDISTEEYLHYYNSNDIEEVARKKIVESYNKDLLRRYPWLRITSKYMYTGELADPNTYEYTWADDIPNGWRIAFGDQMIEELDQLIKRYDVKDYSIEQIKEKFGVLCWYDSEFPERGRDEYFTWKDKYADLSYRTCICCGRPAKYRTKGWIIPVCKECLSKVNCTEESATPIVTQKKEEKQ